MAKDAFLKNQPKEYQQGYSRFFGLKIDLSLKTFIPRPETEFWTRSAINYLQQQKIKEPKILDLCCGSGCIGIAVLKKIKNSCVRFVDIDPRAVKQTKINIALNGIDSRRAKVTKSDLFKNLPRGAAYDAILTNPPYIDKKRSGEIQLSVINYEPAMALFGGGKNGLRIIKQIITDAPKYLKENGSLFLEFDQSQKDEIVQLLQKRGFSDIEFFKDQFGQFRFVRCA